VSRTRRWLLPALAAGVLGAACGGDDPVPGQLGWERTERMPQETPAGSRFEEVPVSAGPVVAWITQSQRAQQIGLNLWREGSGRLEQIPLEPPADVGLVDPRAVHAHDQGWIAVAEVLDPDADTIGLVTWRGGTGTATVDPVALGGPGSLRGGAHVSVARVWGVSVVAVQDEDAPEGVTLWRADDGDRFAARTPTATDGWEAVDASALGLSSPLSSFSLTGDGDRLVLAGVDADEVLHLWVSEDGAAWEAIGHEAVPAHAGRVDRVVAGAPGPVLIQLSGAEVGLLVVEGDEVRVAAPPPLWLTGAVEFDGELVVVGSQQTDRRGWTPMVAVERGEGWTQVEDRAVVRRLDHLGRAVTVVDDELRLLVTGLGRLDVEVWRWRPQQ
jgi:hypothetical protein